MATLTGLAQFINGTAGNHFAAMANKGFDNALQVQQAGLAIHQGHHIDTKHAFELGLSVQVIQQHFAVFAPAHFDHHTNTVFIGFVANFADAFDAFFFHQLSDFLDQASFVHLVGNLGDDDGFFAVLFHLDFGFGAHVHAATAGAVGFDNAAAAIDDA